MSTTSRVLLTVCLLALPLARAAGDTVNYSASAGGRYHIESPVLPDLPFEDGDWSSLFTFDIHEGAGYWQLGVDFGYGAGTNDNVSLVMTPQLNLLAEDKGFVGGLGVLGTYIQDDVEGDHWTDVYYQFLLGFDFPMGKSMALGLMSHYPFADWGELGDFDFGDMEYSASLRFRF